LLVRTWTVDLKLSWNHNKYLWCKLNDLKINWKWDNIFQNTYKRKEILCFIISWCIYFHWQNIRLKYLYPFFHAILNVWVGFTFIFRMVPVCLNLYLNLLFISILFFYLKGIFRHPIIICLTLLMIFPLGIWKNSSNIFFFQVKLFSKIWGWWWLSGKN